MCAAWLHLTQVLGERGLTNASYRGAGVRQVEESGGSALYFLDGASWGTCVCQNSSNWGNRILIGKTSSPDIISSSSSSSFSILETFFKSSVCWEHALTFCSSTESPTSHLGPSCDLTAAGSPEPAVISGHWWAVSCMLSDGLRELKGRGPHAQPWSVLPGTSFV